MELARLLEPGLQLADGSGLVVDDRGGRVQHAGAVREDDAATGATTIGATELGDDRVVRAVDEAEGTIERGRLGVAGLESRNIVSPSVTTSSITTPYPPSRP